MTSPSCPLCALSPSRVFHEGRLVRGSWAETPVAPGHAVIVSRRHVDNWFEATAEERSELAEAVSIARDAARQKVEADGFNIEVNVGSAAGQRVFHLHVDVIPRSRANELDAGDETRSAVLSSGSAPEPASLQRSNTMVERGRTLIHGDDDPLLPHITSAIDRAQHVDIAVAFILESGVRRIHAHLRELLERGGSLRILTGDYLDVTDPNALIHLLDLDGDLIPRVFEAAETGFHPKSYIFHLRDGSGIAFVGSSNLTETALARAVEWNYRVVSSRDAVGFTDIVNAFDRLFSHPATVPLDLAWIERYRARRSVAPAPVVEDSAELTEAPPLPHDVQSEALSALERTRAEGNKAGLVVLATGLGKTWLSAFDSNRPEYRRILFVAHREEILAQALATYRRIRPSATLGHYTGTEKIPDADILFASIQTLGRAQHLQQFSPRDFDYIIVDEFHHAAARTYRRLLDYFQPLFLLGLTATPERTDGGDLLALCAQNLVYRCDLADGISRGLLSPFHYFGVPDEVDYRNIPWRSGRFDDEALTAALATQKRAQNAIDQWRKHAGRRTLAFCCSQRHADFMAEFFRLSGVGAVAVHAGATSAPRATSLEQLNSGELDVVFSVDMFNEGVDLPSVDTVLLLRPTESRITWLQQVGRGLRLAVGKPWLTVIDYIGNHRSFLLKPQTLFQLGPGDAEIARALRQLQADEFTLPPGCEATYDLEAISILEQLLRQPEPDEVLRAYYENFRELHGVRPMAVEAFEEGYNPRMTGRMYGSWLHFVRFMGDFGPTELDVFADSGGFLRELETMPLRHGYALLVLLAMLNAGSLPGTIGVEALTDRFVHVVSRSAVLSRDVPLAFDDRAIVQQMLLDSPLVTLTNRLSMGGTPYFRYDDGVFTSTLNVPDAQVETLQELTREVVEWRVAELLRGARIDEAPATEFLFRVSHSDGGPILRLSDRQPRSLLPEGRVSAIADADEYEVRFTGDAVNVMQRLGSETNALPTLLRRWFGPDAGMSGTRQQVLLRKLASGYLLEPIGHGAQSERQLWQAYLREEIPPLFGLGFSPAVWNQGFVQQPGHLFLLVTLDKGGKDERFQYGDRFLAPDIFQWQSQNRTTTRSAAGESISKHRDRDVVVHLFVRRGGKTPSGKGAPFVYCGPVTFQDWEGEQPITVHWRLDHPVPSRLHQLLRIAGGRGADTVDDS